jgi:hypothetical protein
MAVRRSLHKVGGQLVERLLNTDQGGYQGARVACSEGHEAAFVAYRRKAVVTVLAPVQVNRAYYHCTSCGRGVIPKDQALDIVGTSLSPGVRRMMGRVGGEEAFAEGRRDLEELAGVAVKTKQVERVAEGLGKQIEARARAERQAVLAGKLVSLGGEGPADKFYIAMDATGVPVVPKETAGRAGKAEDGEAKTRDAKLGCVFTQSRLDAKKRPVRDPHSTSYVAAIETAEEFGKRIYAEAVRRGLLQARQAIVLGDGAPWIWALAEEHFPGALQIVDLYHAREHLGELAKTLYGRTGKATAAWRAARYKELEAGKVEAVVAAMKRTRPRDAAGREQVRKEIAYFQTNAERMRYAKFRRRGLFVGSGVVEAGCKTIMGQRLKQSGMRWTLRGANAIIALRCCQVSNRWEEFWEARAASR